MSKDYEEMMNDGIISGTSIPSITIENVRSPIVESLPISDLTYISQSIYELADLHIITNQDVIDTMNLWKFRPV